MTIRILLIPFLIILFKASVAQSINLKKLDSLFTTLQKHQLASGSVAISVDGKIIYQRDIRFSTINNKAATSPAINTTYKIGSVSKMFTAVLVFQLVEEGKLQLNGPLANWFPQLPGADKITIEHLLYHRSGLHDYTRDTNFPAWMDATKTEEEMLVIIKEKGSDFAPGTKADYSNTNYLLLSYIIEKVCGMSYEKVLGKRITAKINLKNTFFGKPAALTGNEIASYKYSDSTWHKEKETAPGMHMGAGSIVSAPSDLVDFIRQLFTGKLISTVTVRRMTTMIDGYGMGIFPYDFDTTKGYGHNGRIEEFYSTVRYFPSQKLAISYITNGIFYPRSDILDGILKICFNQSYSIPFSNQLTLRESDLDKFAGEYSGDLPFKVVCRKQGLTLIFEAGGKIMEAIPIGHNYFMNAKTGTFFIFFPGSGELQIKETDNLYILKKNG